MPEPTPEQLLAFERSHWVHSGAKEELIRTELRVTPARFYQLLGRLVWSEEALQIDPMLTNRLRKREMDSQLERDRRARGGR